MVAFCDEITAKVKAKLSENLSKDKGDDGCISQDMMKKMLAATTKVNDSQVSKAFDE